MRGNLLFPDRYITVASKFKLSLLEIFPSCTNEVIVGESTQFLRSVVCETYSGEALGLSKACHSTK